MVTRGTNLFQSFHVSVFRSVRKTRAAVASMRTLVWKITAAEEAGISGVEKSGLSFAAMILDYVLSDNQTGVASDLVPCSELNTKAETSRL